MIREHNADIKKLPKNWTRNKYVACKKLRYIFNTIVFLYINRKNFNTKLKKKMY